MPLSLKRIIKKLINQMFQFKTLTAGLLFLFVLSCAITNKSVNAQEIPFKSRFTSKQLSDAPVKLIPFPQEVKWQNKKHIVNRIWFGNYAQTSKLLRDETYRLCVTNRVEIDRESDYLIHFKTDHSISKEGYWLDVKTDEIIITASTETGHYYGLKTLRQLFETDQFDSRVALCSIKDKPGFPIRGYMNDVGRNFQSVESIKKHLDLLANYKMNVFHFHLTDHPAWRIESKIYPQLNLPKNCRARRDPGFYYTFDELRSIIRYAKQRKIMVIPEIDMPGHSGYFKETFGFKMESKEGMVVLEALLKEFFNEIPKEMAPYIHLGSDEVKVHNPVEFVNKMVGFVESDGRKAIIWYPGLKANKSVIRQIWGSEAPLESEGLTEIDSKINYINVGEPMSHIPSLFLKPIGKYSKNKTIGGIVCLWHDVNTRTENDFAEQNPLYSSIITYSWATWTADILSSPDKYILQIPEKGSEAFEYFKAFEQFLLFHKEKYFKHQPFPYAEQCNKHWKLYGPFEGNDDDNLVLKKEQKSYRYKGKKINCKEVTGNTIMLTHSWKKGAHFPKVAANSTLYAVTYIKSDRQRKVPAWIGFTSSSRNYKTKVGIADNGQFDMRGSRVWINGEEVEGPTWRNPVKKSMKWDKWKVRETAWNAEEFYWLRQPSTILLKEGINRVVIKVPYKSENQTSLFNFTILETEGLTFLDK
ncbi:beta-N-acetylhexosaminidase [Prolixibacteraceae bacterium JC049]|nr:beta-N-acetylhexosaminidase [Prolixibacteraceae bacterium JC049]